LLSGWNALSDLSHLNKSSKSYGLLMKWDFEREWLLVGGDTKVLRLWDVKTELRKGDWPTGHDSPVTSIDSHRCGESTAPRYRLVP
jgi:WD40 repeat protein